MNKKEAEKKIRELAKQVCVKHDAPDNATMDELSEAGYLVERLKLSYLDGLRITYPDGSMRYATTIQTTKGRQDRCTIYDAEDVHRYETCTRMLINADKPRDVYTVDAYADAITADGLRNQIKEACTQMRKALGEMEAEPEPTVECGQDDETPLECYEGFDPEPMAPEQKAEPIENPLEWLKRAHEGITVSRKNERACWWVSGNTKPMKEKLKAMGFKWAPKKKMWYLKPQTA